MLSRWSTNVRHLYHRVVLKHEEEPYEYDDASGPNTWSQKRHRKVLELRNNALKEARQQWADYILVNKVPVPLSNFFEKNPKGENNIYHISGEGT